MDGKVVCAKRGTAESVGGGHIEAEVWENGPCPKILFCFVLFPSWKGHMHFGQKINKTFLMSLWRFMNKHIWFCLQMFNLKGWNIMGLHGDV
jgi:hypothetical protein